MTITVYYDPASGPSRCIIVLLNLIKDTTVVRQQISLANKEQMTPEYLEMNPFHTVPTLKDDETGLCLFESTSIMQFLAEKFGFNGKYGLPTDEKAKWATINALHNQHNFVSKATMDILCNFYGPLFTGQQFDLEKFKAGIEVAKPKFQILEDILTKNGGFIAGSEPTIADIRAWSDIIQLSTLGGDATLDVIDFSVEFPVIQKWLVTVKDAVWDEEMWKAVIGFYGLATGLWGGSPFRIAKQ